MNPDIQVGDRLPMWALVKALSMPEHKVLDLMDRLGLPLDRARPSVVTSRTAFRELLEELAGT